MNQHTTTRHKRTSPYDALIADLMIVRVQRQLHEKHGMATDRDDKLIDLACDRLVAEYRWNQAVDEPATMHYDNQTFDDTRPGKARA